MKTIIKIAVLSFLLSGCTWGSHPTGWTFQIGMVPVQQVNHQTGLGLPTESLKTGRNLY